MLHMVTASKPAFVRGTRVVYKTRDGRRVPGTVVGPPQRNPQHKIGTCQRCPLRLQTVAGTPRSTTAALRATGTASGIREAHHLPPCALVAATPNDAALQTMRRHRYLRWTGGRRGQKGTAPMSPPRVKALTGRQVGW